MLQGYLTFHNTQPLFEAAIPRVPLERLAESVVASCRSGGRLVLWFGRKMGQGTGPSEDVRVYAVVADDANGLLGVAAADTVRGTVYPSMTPALAQASRFEREVFEQMEIVPRGHPRLEPLRQHTALFDHGSTDDRPSARTSHEIAVGPIHAGIIGPGHFRFTCRGETIDQLDVRLGYEHRGVEDLVTSARPNRVPLLIETIAGDASIAYATAHSELIEAQSGCGVSPRAEALRGIALEVERLANHVGDLGALAADIGFWAGSALFGRLRGEFLNTSMELTGNRYGRGFVRPGGVTRDLAPERAATILDRLKRVRVDLKRAVESELSAASVLNRFEATSSITLRQAIDHGFVGPIARASGLSIDVRHDHPSGIWRFAHIPLALGSGGSVLDRALLRRLESERSLAFLIEQIERLPEGAARVACPPGPPRRGDFAVALAESWRGEVALALIRAADGSIARFKVQDPSFHNWEALEIANREGAVSDFPVTNKSCNLSYCGHDL